LEVGVALTLYGFASFRVEVLFINVCMYVRSILKHKLLQSVYHNTEGDDGRTAILRCFADSLCEHDLGRNLLLLLV